MSYEPTNWVTGDIVTADKLNKIESGVLSASGGGGTLALTQDADTGALDKTWKEIHDAIASGQIPVVSMVVDNAAYLSIIFTAEAGESYIVFNDDTAWVTDSENGYPVIEQA